MAAHLVGAGPQIKRGDRNAARTSRSFKGLWIKIESASFYHRYGRGQAMLHLGAILFFSGVLVALALVIQFTVRDHWQNMVAAFLGRPMARQRVRTPAPARVSVPNSQRPRRAAA
jgi:hypothetical protein